MFKVTGFSKNIQIPGFFGLNFQIPGFSFFSKFPGKVATVYLRKYLKEQL